MNLHNKEMQYKNIIKEFCTKYNCVIPITDIGYSLFYDFIIDKMKKNQLKSNKGKK